MNNYSNYSNQNDLFKTIGWYTFFLLKWSDITAKTVIFGAKLLGKAKPYLKTPRACYSFFKPKVACTEDFQFFNMAKIFEVGFFCNIEIWENT